MKNLESFKNYEIELKTIKGGNRPRATAITLSPCGVDLDYHGIPECPGCIPGMSYDIII